MSLPDKKAEPSSAVDQWINRLIRLSGLGIAFYETIVEHNDRLWLLGTACAMMAGSVGLELILKKWRG